MQEHPFELYGAAPGDDKSFAAQCLTARRLVERGVRTVEIIDTGASNNWDSHGNMQDHRPKALRVDQPLAALIGDLKQLPPVMEEAASTFKIEEPLDEMVRDDSFYGWIWDKVSAGSRIMLPRQYRMREPIGRVVSDLFYDGKLIHEAQQPTPLKAAH